MITTSFQLKTILVHLPAYREPELVPTIIDCLRNAKFSERIHFGICRQYCESDGFDDIDKFRLRKGFKVIDVPFEEAQGLAWARAQINERLLDTEDYILQLDSHHRFIQDWDEILIQMHDGLKSDGIPKPLIGGYLPMYSPEDDPNRRVDCPWQAQFACFYPFGTIFIRPGELPNWENLNKPPRARFLSGHFCFGDAQWAKDVLHDPDIFFSGEEINLTVRSFTHGYDIFHSHKLIIWHATMRKERDGILVWDDQNKLGKVDWHAHQMRGRSKIKQLFCGVDNGFTILPKYGLGHERTIEEYENFAGINFKNHWVQEYTIANNYPPNPKESTWVASFYHLVHINRAELPGADYQFILIAFDDNTGTGIHSRKIEAEKLESFYSGHSIHYEEIFFHNTDIRPVRMVAWGYSSERGWVERIERSLL